MSDNFINKGLVFCSFCGKSQNSVKTMISAAHIFICDVCTTICANVLDENIPNDQNNFLQKKMKTPEELYNELNKVVEGQYGAKKKLSVAIYNHYKKVLYNLGLYEGLKQTKTTSVNGKKKSTKKIKKSKKDTVSDSIEIAVLDSALDPNLLLDKSNVLCIGPSGSGKTLMIQTLAKILNLPLAIIDSTALTEVGYVGADVDSALMKLLQVSGLNSNKSINDVIKEAEYGIIIFDEVDKIGRKSASPSHNRDISGEGVQQSMLKLIEGDLVTLSVSNMSKKNLNININMNDSIQIDTQNILFIFMGSFEGLDKIINKETNKKAIGINNGCNKNDLDYNNIIKNVNTDHLLKFGLIPELIGRIPNIVIFNELTVENLSAILISPQNAILKQYKYLLSMDQTELVWTDQAIKKIAELSKKNNTGARGLKNILENLFSTIMYSLTSIPGKKQVILDEEAVQNKELKIQQLSN